MCQQLLTMASKPPIASSLNPNAPAFVPAAYLAAEDFSPEWWRLIQTCPSFRDYWLKERHTTEENEQQAAAAAEADEFDEIDDLLELGMMSIQLDEDETEEPSASFSFRGSPKQQQANERKPGAKYTSREYSSEHKYSPPEQYFPRFDGKGRTEVTNLDGNRHMVNARRGEFSGTSDLGKLDGTKYWSFVQPSHPTFPRGQHS